MKKVVSFAVAFCLLLSLALPVMATAEEKVTLKVIVTPNIPTKDVNTVAYLNEMAEKANVNIEWEPITSGYGELKSVMLASGDLPDILLGSGSVAESDFAQFPELFADMTELLPYAPNVTKMFEEKPEIQKMVTSLDGKIYGLSKYQRYWPSNMTRQMINKTWLDRLGLNVPTTWDELFDVLMAFKEKDANGNGDPNDEVPMDWAPGISGFHVFSMLAGAGVPVSMYQGQGYYVQDGVVKNFFVAEEFKQLVLFLDKCFANGLINANVFTQDYTSFQNLSRSGVVGFTFGWDILDRMGPDLDEQYITVAPLKPGKDYAGPVMWENDYYLMNYAYPLVAISADSQHKEAAMRFVDLFYDPYYGMQTLFGSMGECIGDNGDGTYTVLPPADPTVDPGTWKWINALADFSPMYISDTLELTLPSDMQKINELDQVYAEGLSLFGEDDLWPGPFLKYTSEQSTELSNLNLDITGIFSNKMATWITMGGVEAEWDEYLKTLDQAGLQEAIGIYQEVVNAFYGK